MPITITESDAFPTTLTAPAAGEPASAPALLSQYLQGVANRTRYLLNRRTTDAASITSNGARVSYLESLVVGGVSGSTYSIWIPLSNGLCTDTGGIRDWYPSFSTYNTRPILLAASNIASPVIFDISPYLPVHGGYLLSATATLHPASGHAGLPVTMPTIAVFSQATGVGTSSHSPAITTLMSGTDSSGNVTAFQLVHGMTASGAPVSIDASKNHFIQINGEGGTNALTTCVITGLQILIQGGP